MGSGKAVCLCAPFSSPDDVARILVRSPLCAGVDIPGHVSAFGCVASPTSAVVTCHSAFKGIEYTVRGHNFVKLVLSPLRKAIFSKRKDFAQFGSRFFVLIE